MRENTPPSSPYRTDEEDEELIYVGDDIDEVIDQLEEMPEEEDEDMNEGKSPHGFNL